MQQGETKQIVPESWISFVEQNIERQLIIDRRSPAEIKRAAKAEGMRFLREAALQKVFAGETTLHDVNKVTFVE